MLILQAERDALLKPLLAVTGIVERRHTLPILSNVLIEKKNGQVSFCATDLEIQITTTSFDDFSGTDFRLTTSAKKLQDILRAIQGNSTVTLEQLASGRLTLRAGKSRFNLQTLPSDDFPLLSVGGACSSSFSLCQGELRRLISQTQYAMAMQDIRYYLNGLLMQIDGNQVRLVATDGHRLAFASTEVDADLPKSEVILPRKSIIELYKLLQDIDDPINIEMLANQVRCGFGPTTIISKVVDGKFPDYKRVIPLDNDKIFMVKRLAFLHALQRASILANEKFRGVRLILKSGSISILCTNSEQEEAEEELEIAYEGGELEICFNINYLMDVLTHLPAEELQLGFGDCNRSTLVTMPDVTSFQYVVMPMRM